MVPQRRLLLCISLSLPCFSATPQEIKKAAQRSIVLLQNVNSQWKNPCFSCHHQLLPALALSAARSHGLAVDEKLALTSNTRDYKVLLDLDGAVRVDALIDPAVSEGSTLIG